MNDNLLSGRVVIATKCFFPVYDSPVGLQAFAKFAEDPELVNRVGLSRKHIFDAVEASLKVHFAFILRLLELSNCSLRFQRLGVDYIDLYQIHRLDTVSNLSYTDVS